MKIIKTMVLSMLVSALWINSTPATAQTPRDSAAERSRAQKNSSPTDDQASPAASPGDRQMLQDTGGKSGTQGIGRENNDNTGKNADPGRISKEYGKRNTYIMWGVVILIAAVFILLLSRIKRKTRL
ncbi:hypothetical protein [Mucilaginibacter oryzae]|nr:hypothetical protein [Mucilaginibacter oryzae]